MLDKTERIARVKIDTRVPRHIRIVNGSLDDDPDSPHSIVLSGRIDQNTLRFLNVDKEYQRTLDDRADIFDALKSGVVVPNLVIGVRGTDYERDGDDYIIRSPCYIVDGWQRVGTALRLLELIPNHVVRMFGSFHFGTDQLWEGQHFTALNKNIKRVSPNLHMRNMRDGNDAILTLYGLSFNTRDFPLYKRICWAQNMARGDLVTATVAATCILMLHSHHVAMGARRVDDIASGLMTAASAVSLPTFRQNITTFFSIIDECWNFRAIEFRSRAPYIKGSFLNVLARVFSNHPVFWIDGGRKLFVDADDRRKLGKFRVNDPHIANLCGSQGAANKLLYEMLVRHFDSGRRTQRLVAR